MENRVPEEGSEGDRLEGCGYVSRDGEQHMGLPFFTYLLQCSDQGYYVGHTDDLKKRLEQHQSGEGSPFTRSRLPVNIVWHHQFPTRDEAKAAEAQLKGWNRAKKEALIAGRWDMISRLAGRGAEARALRDALLRKAPQERGSLNSREAE